MKNYKIGNLRALAILMVVLGHSIILYSPAWTLYESDRSCYPLVVVLSIIDIIQMPLYFSISGYLFYYSLSKRKTFKNFLINKVRRLIIPFLISALCWMIPIRCLVSYDGYQDQSIMSIVIKKVIWGSDNGHLWFLETLFFIFIIMYFVCGYLYKKSRNWLYALTWGGLLVVSLFSYRFNRIPIMKNTALYMIWFYTGLLIHHCEQYFQVSKYKIWRIVLPVVSIGGGIIYLMMPATVIRYVVSLLNVIALYTIIPEKSNAFIRVIEDNSYGIYLFHSPLIYITCTYFLNKSPVIVVFINFFVFGSISILLTCLLRKGKARFIIGEV